MANLLLLAGLWVRSLSGTDGHGYLWILLGQAFGGAGQVFLMNSPSKVATVWFARQERAKATALISLSLTAGSIVSLLLSAQMAKAMNKSGIKVS